MKGRGEAILLAAATTAGVVLCILLAAPFLAPLTGALTLAILFAPVHGMFEKKLRHPNLAATLSVLALALIVILPAAFVFERLVEEAATGAVYIQKQVESGAVQRVIDYHPRIAPIGNWIEERIDLRAIMATLATGLSNFGASLVRGSVVQVIAVILTFYLLFYFLRDRRAALGLVRRLLPLTPEETNRLFGRVVDTVLATIYGTVAVAAVQGTLGGIMFWLLDLPTPIVWALVMGLLSIVPVLGTFIVWIPAAFFLALDGSWGKALVLAVWGAIVIGGIDNLLRPMLVGNRLKLHTVPTFLSIIGGLILFGASGFILGPLILTVTMLLVETWRSRGSNAVGPETPKRALSSD